MSSPQLPVCVIDDDPLVRKTIADILTDADYDVRVFESGRELLDAYDEEKTNSGLFGCILLDVKMPGLDGLEVLSGLVERKIELPVVMISGQGDISTAVAAMRMGAIDFVEKPFTPEQLLLSVKLNYRAAITPDQAVPAALAILSPREMEVLQLLVEGDANKVIAYKLGISQRTVEVHRARIMERLEVRTFAELVRKAIEAGL
jgi:two-component system response regulator FixJ